MTKAGAWAALALGLSRALAGASEPSWSGATVSGADWCRVDFLDEFGETRKLWCPAKDCCPAAKAEGEEAGAARNYIPLYLFQEKKDPEVVGIPYYETTTSVYRVDRDAKGYLLVRRDGLKAPLTIVSKVESALAATPKLVVKWTKGREPEPPMTPMSEGVLHKPCREAAGASSGQWYKSRFLPLETEMVENLALLKDAKIDGLLACPRGECGDPGTEGDYKSGNHRLLNAYAVKLRPLIRKAVEAERREPSSSFETKFTEFEADLLHCLITESRAASEKKGAGAFRKGMDAALGDKAKMKAFVRGWRDFVQAELSLYMAQSEGVQRGGIEGLPEKWKDLAARTSAALAGEELAKTYEGAGLKRPSAKAKVGKASQKKIDDAGSWAEGLVK